MKKLWKNLIYDGTSSLKSEIMSYLDNAYDITNFFVVLKSSWPKRYSCPAKFHCCQMPNARVKLGGGGGFSAPLHYRGIPDPVQNRVNDGKYLSFTRNACIDMLSALKSPFERCRNRVLQWF